MTSDIPTDIKEESKSYVMRFCFSRKSSSRHEINDRPVDRQDSLRGSLLDHKDGEMPSLRLRFQNYCLDE
jgi:hypothetical protein